MVTSDKVRHGIATKTAALVRVAIGDWNSHHTAKPLPVGLPPTPRAITSPQAEEALIGLRTSCLVSVEVGNGLHNDVCHCKGSGIDLEALLMGSIGSSVDALGLDRWTCGIHSLSRVCCFDISNNELDCTVVLLCCCPHFAVFHSHASHWLRIEFSSSTSARVNPEFHIMCNLAYLADMLCTQAFVVVCISFQLVSVLLVTKQYHHQSIAENTTHRKQVCNCACVKGLGRDIDTWRCWPALNYRRKWCLRLY